MTTPILKIQEVSDGQINQFLVYNAALRALESAANNFLSVNLSSGSVTLSETQYNGNFLFYASGNTVARSITVPVGVRMFAVYNSGSFELSVVRGTAIQAVAPGSSSIFYSDGTANGLIKFGSSSAGGLAWFSGSKNSTTPNTAVPVAIISPDDSPANMDVAIVPKGTGGFMLAAPDNSSSGGNKRGDWAVDLQCYRQNATQVASGALSFAAGANATASGGYSVAIQGAVASGSRSVAIGSGSIASSSDSVALGANCSALSELGWAIGTRASTFGRKGVLAWSSGRFSSNGDSQSLHVVLRRQTTDSAVSELTTDGSFGGPSNQVALQNFSCVSFKGLVMARQNSTGDTKSWEVSGLVKRGANAAATALVGSPVINVLGADSGASVWDVSISADVTNGALKISAAGEASKTIRWTCVLDCAELIG